MKVKLNNGRIARVTVEFGNECPKLQKPLPPRAEGKAFRSVRLTLNVHEDEAMEKPPVVTATGMSFCSPLDQFEKFEGRRLAMLRLKSVAPGISKEDWRILCPAMLRGPIVLQKK